MKYPVVLHKEEGTAYGVTVPDIPGCFSAGESINEALENTVEAINGHLEILAEDGAEIPKANDIEKYKDQEEFKQGIWALVEVDITPFLGNTVRVNITLPERLLKKIDAYVADHKEFPSRSAFLAHLSMKQIRS